MSWSILPAALKLNIIHHLLASLSTIDHATHTDNLVCGVLETLISTNNTALVTLSLEAYYNTNTFVIKPHTSYAGFKEQKKFRPGQKHSQKMKRIIDETVPVSPPAGVPVTVDSGYASRDSESVDGDLAPDVMDLACALGAIVAKGSAGKRGERQRRLFDCMYYGECSRSQRRFERRSRKTSRARYE